MKSLKEVLDLAKQKNGSDYRTAKLLGVERATVSGWRKKGSLDNENAAKLAEMTGVDFQKIVAMSEAAKHPDKAMFWGKVIAASVILAASVTVFSPLNTTGYIPVQSNANMYYA